MSDPVCWCGDVLEDHVPDDFDADRPCGRYGCPCLAYGTDPDPAFGPGEERP